MFSRRWFTTALTTSALGVIVACTSGFARRPSAEGGGERINLTSANGCCCGLACDCQDCGCDCGLERCGCEAGACGCDGGACAAIS